MLGLTRPVARRPAPRPPKAARSPARIGWPVVACCRHSRAYRTICWRVQNRQSPRGACGAQRADLQRNSGERRAAGPFDQHAVRNAAFAVRIEIGGIRAFPATPTTPRRDFLEPGRPWPPRRSIIAVRRTSLSFLPPSSCRHMSFIRASATSLPPTHRDGTVERHAAPPRTIRDRRHRALRPLGGPTERYSGSPPQHLEGVPGWKCRLPGISERRRHQANPALWRFVMSQPPSEVNSAGPHVSRVTVIST